MILHSHSFVLPKISVDVIMIVKPFFWLLGYATAIGVAAIRICRGVLRTGSHLSISNERGSMSYRVGTFTLANWMKKAISLSLIVSGLLLIGCGGGGSGGSGDGDSHSGMNNMSVDGGGDNGGDGGGDHHGMNNMSLDGGGGGPSLPAEVELSISPFVGGLRIRWHNLSAVEQGGGIYIHLNLTSNDDPPEIISRHIAVEDFTNNNYEIDGLANGTAYRLVEVAIEFADNISRVIDNIVWSEPWQTKTNALDQEGNGIVVGVNYDGDGRADGVDEDDDNDGVNNTRADGTQWDLCRQGDLGWTSNETSYHDGDGCQDNGTANGGYGEDEDDDNDGVADSMDTCPVGRRDWRNDGTNDFDGDGCRNDEDLDGDNDGVLNTDEEAGCELDPNCDNDEVLDINEESGCAKNPDCDDDGVGDGNEMIGCVKNPDCDSDGDRDNVDIDGDGDGLIEIGTAEQLDAVRYVLNGTGFKANEGAALNQTGCGDGADISECFGYELVRDISLVDYIARTDPTKGWQPIAHDTNPSTADCDGEAFTGIFDGNGFVIGGLFINRSTEHCIGLFSQIRGGKILNLGVIVDKVIGKNRVGGLVAFIHASNIIQSYVISGSVGGSVTVGGLVGQALLLSIVQSYAVSGGVRASDVVGGLVGNTASASIIQSYAVSSEVSGTNNDISSLVGLGGSALVIDSYAVS